MAQPPTAPAGQPWPFFDLFLDVPHPAASPHTPPAYVFGPPTTATGGTQDSIDQELSKNMPQIARFAFPEFDQDASPPPPPDQAPPVNRFDQYAMQPPAFQNYTFSLTLQSGMRVHGHVRRYLPCHIGAKTRYDVGRRGERALVILTRVTGADAVYSAVLKTVDALTSHMLAMPQYLTKEEPQKKYLHELFQKHQKIAISYAAKPPDARNKPVFLTIQDLEVGTMGAKKFAHVDFTHFLLPRPLLLRTSMGDLVSNSSRTSILPVLRCLGVAHTLRLLCAALCERRVILISASPTRLATCFKSIIGILAQGLLHWQHLYIPVLPPHLWQYLAAPYPYLIGILAALTPRLDRTDGLGEVLIINLDHNNMETRGIPTDKINERIPDLLRNMNADPYSVQQFATGQALPASSPEMLAQDLVELLKNDKKTLNGESALASMQDTAAKATKAVKGAFFKLKEKSKSFLKTSSYSENDQEEPPVEPVDPPEVNPMAPDYIYTEGCRNEMGEEEARIAFCSFFVSMIGNMRWYLSAQPGQPPQLDRQRFLQQKRTGADGEQSSMWPLLQTFCQTQMLEEFAKLRVEELRLRQQVTVESPLFLQCSNYHNQHKIDYGLLNVRRVTRQVAQSRPSTLMQDTSARRIAMELTSKRAFEGDYNKVLADLVEQCRESSSVLFDVMSVVWIRMRDNRGLQWRHATHSLHILKNLLFHGPIAAVAEATDGLDKIRALKYYNGNRQTSICVQIRTAATQVYSLVVDRSKLFHIRRVCINKRRALRMQNRPNLARDPRLQKAISVPFHKVHAAMNPGAPRAAPAPRTPPASVGQPAQQYNATPTFAVLPPPQTQAPPPAARPAPVAQNSGIDLLGLNQPAAPVAAQAQSSNTDIFGVFGGGQQQAPPAAASTGSDMFGIFGDMAIGGQAQSQPPPAAQFAPQQPPPPANHYVAQQQHHHHQYHRSRSTSPVPPHQQLAHTRSLSPTPPSFSQQPPQANLVAQPPPQQYAGQMAPQQQRSVSPVPPNRNRAMSHSPTPPFQQQQAYAQPQAGYAMQPGAVPAFAQAPNSGGYRGPPPMYQGNQAPNSGNAFAYPPQQQQQPPPPGAYGGQPPSQTGPFF
ncbi:DENN domain-containing protein 1A [Seminavis robusta]|uniref:DENN domain-containing protein 1A n=1 Tax=Seminavis robusta TaxID=568900 RepID=A0A9N8H439_9STRA|nr:DENN domain-containing protein 1A [Seminavis robusta]|eukprot:Sro104_g052660.1 DENN domain-containing protein 1A (1102) ;mRNA; r:10198-13690